MAQQTIDAVREAEKKAEQMERSAVQQAEECLQSARADAERTVEHMAAEADKQAQASLLAARKRGDTLADKAAKEAEQEIASLRAHAKQKQKEAVTSVIAELVG